MNRYNIHRSILILLIALPVLAGSAFGQSEEKLMLQHHHDDQSGDTEKSKHQSHDDHKHAGHMHHRFEKAEEWAERFEKPERDEWQKPDEVIRFLNLNHDDKIADIGSATGYFPVRLARAVPNGFVWGMDIEPDMVRYLNERAKKEGLKNLESRPCTESDAAIPEPVDVIFMCNTYHHVGHRIDYFSRLKKDLRKGGRLVMIDFLPGDLPEGPPAKHKIPPMTVVYELTKAGYRPTDSFVGLPYQFLYVFESE
jgi:cyclopropane fatty-acyl-phospholipid synthase-like methyltransferase